MIELVLIGLAVVVALALTKFYPDATKLWFQRFITARRFVFAILGISVALVFIGTGSPLYMLVGFSILVYSVLFVIYEQPHKEVTSWFNS